MPPFLRWRGAEASSPGHRRTGLPTTASPGAALNYFGAAETRALGGLLQLQFAGVKSALTADREESSKRANPGR